MAETALLGQRLTLPAAARVLGVSTKVLETLVRRRQIPYHRFAPTGRHYFYESELAAFLASTRVDPCPSATGAPDGLRPRSVSHLMPTDREFV